MSINNNIDVLQEIKNRLNIVDVVSKTVILKKKGNNYWGLCPFHEEKTPSFSVNPQKGIYKCFGCGEGGDVISFLQKIQNKKIPEIIKEQAEILGIELPDNYKNFKDNAKQKKELLAVLKDASEIFNKNLFDSKEAEEALSYLKKRDINDEVINTYQLGYASNNVDSLYKKLSEKYSAEIMEQAGLITKNNLEKGYKDRFRHRITIPIFDENGNIIAFGARALGVNQSPKYLNSSDSIIYNKSRILYGLYHAKEAIKAEDSVIIMEGYFDVISTQSNGIKNCVASCGTSLTAGHVNLIARYSQSRRIYLAFDSDEAGLNATKRGAEVIKNSLEGLGDIHQFDEMNASLSNDKYSCEIRVVSPPDNKDPDEFIRANGSEAYKEYLAKAPLLIDFELDLALRNFNKNVSLQEKIKFVQKIVPILSNIKNEISKDEYVKIISQKMAIEERSLKLELSRVFQPLNPISVKNPIVKNRINFSEKAQKILLSVYLMNICPLEISQISEMLINIKLDSEKLNYIKSTIDKCIDEINNVNELIEYLYNYFAEDNETKNIITDLIEQSKVFEGLSEKDLRLAIKESVANIEKFKQRQANKLLKEEYSKIEDDDTVEALELQMKLKDKLKTVINREIT